MPLVVDASVTLSWCFRDEQTPYSLAVLERLREEEAVVPAIWAFEVANGILTAERRGRLTPADVAALRSILGNLPFALREATLEDAFGTVLDLARTHSLSVYDAAYLDLAVREQLPLATQHADLRTAAESAGVTLLT